MRSSSHKWAAHRALEDVAAADLQWYRGGEQLAADREFARKCLEHTLLRHVEGAPEDSPVVMLAEEVLEFFNTPWEIQLVGHRCKKIFRRGVWEWCCKNRLAEILWNPQWTSYTFERVVSFVATVVAQ